MNRKNLRKRKGGGYAVVYYVPTELHHIVGKREIVRGLGTKDEKEAMRLKPSKLLEIQGEVNALVNGHEYSCTNLTKEAADYAKQRRDMEQTATDYAATENLEKEILYRAEIIQEKLSSCSKAKKFADIAFGKHIPISVAAREWRRVWEGITPHTQAKYERALSAFQEFFGDCPIDTITRQDAISYLEHLRTEPSDRTGRPLATATIKAEVSTLSSLFKACVSLGLLPQNHENPFARILEKVPGQRMEVVGKKDAQPITRDEAEQFLAACDNSKRGGRKPLKYSFEMQALIRLLWVTGARANEIASLTRDRIKDEGNLLWLQIRDAKTPAGNRWLCLVGEPERELVRQALREADKALEGSEEKGNAAIPNENRTLMFPRLRRGGPDRKPYWYLGKALEKVRKGTFGESVDWDMHSFRRTVAAMLAEADVWEYERNLVLGHSNPKDVGMRVYAKDADLFKAVERTMRKLYHELGGSLLA